MRPAALFLLIVVLTAASTAPAHLPDHERQQIAELAQRYLQHRADKVTNSPQVAGFGVATTDSLAAGLRDDERKLRARNALYSSLPGRGYSRAVVSTTLRRLHVDPDGSVVVHVREVTELHFARTGSVTHSTFSMTTVLVFDRTATGWVLAAAIRPPGTACGMPAETEFCGHLTER
ncbi:hypothetical protein ACFOWZ_19870 [Lentzea rhizosphaerae]|uniref:DUF4440 domain-containing protein n=1 Tax=Lentzea rhizosphaerae TaxID=2041025 RepID=A0ABV8BTX4_9PSEU